MLMVRVECTIPHGNKKHSTRHNTQSLYKASYFYNFFSIKQTTKVLTSTTMQQSNIQVKAEIICNQLFVRLKVSLNLEEVTEEKKISDEQRKKY